ncbi:hypothetical protein RIVM261_026200 [Rivularia sp. IAM M-261]|nr:hypothetical protein RIVM261_026200 [Rivularia sp. IAM M-261]
MTKRLLTAINAKADGTRGIQPELKVSNPQQVRYKVPFSIPAPSNIKCGDIKRQASTLFI